ncbi:MAG: threonine aldolase [Bradymonadia bacterium]|jgi:threonine aldolase
MREAMLAAPLGDDVFGDDPTVNLLQTQLAELLGKERALFVPSGTMANQLAVRSHTCSGDEIVLHHRSHIYNYEGGGAAALAGVSIRTIESADGSLPLDAVEAALHLSSDPHFAPTSLVCFENTNNGCGGVIVPQDNITAVMTLVRERAQKSGKEIGFHLDGARLFNAQAASGVPVRELAAGFDTVSICLSKGLGAPVGSVLVGSEALIQRAYRFRKMYGGGMRQAGILAAAGLHALKHHVAGLTDDHRRAKRLASGFAAIDGVHVDLDSVQSNLVYFDLPSDHPLASVGEDDIPLLVGRLLREHGVMITGSPTRMRAVLHLGIDDEDVAATIDAMKTVTKSA